jgi:hypothetical protein
VSSRDPRIDACLAPVPAQEHLNVMVHDVGIVHRYQVADGRAGGSRKLKDPRRT